jgi:hypothetical protein
VQLRRKKMTRQSFKISELKANQAQDNEQEELGRYSLSKIFAGATGIGAALTNVAMLANTFADSVNIQMLTDMSKTQSIATWGACALAAVGSYLYSRYDDKRVAEMYPKQAFNQSADKDGLEGVEKTANIMEAITNTAVPMAGPVGVLGIAAAVISSIAAGPAMLGGYAGVKNLLPRDIPAENNNTPQNVPSMSVA